MQDILRESKKELAAFLQKNFPSDFSYDDLTSNSIFSFDEADSPELKSAKVIWNICSKMQSSIDETLVEISRFSLNINKKVTALNDLGKKFGEEILQDWQLFNTPEVKDIATPSVYYPVISNDVSLELAVVIFRFLQKFCFASIGKDFYMATQDLVEFYNTENQTYSDNFYLLSPMFESLVRKTPLASKKYYSSRDYYIKFLVLFSTHVMDKINRYIEIPLIELEKQLLGDVATTRQQFYGMVDDPNSAQKMEKLKSLRNHLSERQEFFAKTEKFFEDRIEKIYGINRNNSDINKVKNSIFESYTVKIADLISSLKLRALTIDTAIETLDQELQKSRNQNASPSIEEEVLRQEFVSGEFQDAGGPGNVGCTPLSTQHDISSQEDSENLNDEEFSSEDVFLDAQSEYEDDQTDFVNEAEIFEENLRQDKSFEEDLQREQENENYQDAIYDEAGLAKYLDQELLASITEVEKRFVASQVDDSFLKLQEDIYKTRQKFDKNHCANLSERFKNLMVQHQHNKSELEQFCETNKLDYIFESDDLQSLALSSSQGVQMVIESYEKRVLVQENIIAKVREELVPLRDKVLGAYDQAIHALKKNIQSNEISPDHLRGYFESDESSSGKIQDYLKNRKKYYYKSTCLFSFFRDTEGEKREHYLETELQPALESFCTTPNKEHKESLIKIIDQGLKQFKPRTYDKDDERYKETLKYLLETLKVKVENFVITNARLDQYANDSKEVSSWFQI